MNILWMNTGERFVFRVAGERILTQHRRGPELTMSDRQVGLARRARAAIAPEKRRFRRNPNGDRGLSVDE
jgi:hypothetical protein